jgi:4a-hydroxytetrahydrobiopterin dehydratase
MTTSSRTAQASHMEQRLADEEIHDLQMTVPNWLLHGDNYIEREFMCKDFRDAINFVNKIAELAEKMNHHPEMCIDYNKVDVKLSTHKAGGLTHKDFDLAAQIDHVK